MQMKGVFIPGLSMERRELPDIEGFLRLQNAEVGDGQLLPDNYSVEDLAEIHVKTIKNSFLPSETVHIVGMSLGGMIISTMASHFRNQLPKNCRFYFLATSANLKENSSITQQMLSDWKKVRPGDFAGMKRVLTPFFSESFLNKNPNVADAYFQYRANGENQQTAKSFMKQVAAVLSFEGAKYYKQINPKECQFIHAGADRIFDQKHVADLKSLVPEAVHIVWKDLGHMINIENPQIFAVA